MYITDAYWKCHENFNNQVPTTFQTYILRGKYLHKI